MSDEMKTEDRFMRMPEVVRTVGRSRTSIHYDVKEGRFPKPHKIGRRAIAWKESEIKDWIASRDLCGGKNIDLEHELLEVLALSKRISVENIAQVFFNYSGHVNLLDLRIRDRNTDWRGSHKDIFTAFARKVPLNGQNAEKDLIDLRERLQKLRDTGDLSVMGESNVYHRKRPLSNEVKKNGS